VRLHRLWLRALHVAAIAAVGCSEQALTPVVVSQAGMLDVPAAIRAEPPTRELPSAPERGETFQRGIVLGPLVASAKESVFKREQTRLLDRAAALGATDVQVVVRWLQPSPTAVEIAPYETVHDELLTWVLDYARRRKLRVQLSPQLGVASAPESTESGRAGQLLRPSSWERWWWSYERFVLHYARVAAMRKVPALSIGSELTKAESQSERWRKLVAEVRGIYKGRLTYVASAQSFDQVGFWDALDVVSVAVDQERPSSEGQLVERLAPLARRLAAAGEVRERGYVLVEGTCGGEAPDATDALVCKRALYKSFRDERELRGVYVPAPSDGTRRDGEAAEVVRQWFKKSKR